VAFLPRNLDDQLKQLINALNLIQLPRPSTRYDCSL